MPPDASIASVAAALRAAADPSLLRKLDRLRLATHPSVTERAGHTPIPRASQPSGLELTNHKAYTPGDDLRYLDWNAYGRLGQRLIRTFRAEREAPLHILLDTSASMAVPTGDGKLSFAAALATGLAYLALRQHNPVRAATIGSEGRCQLSPVLGHVQRLPELLRFLEPLAAGGSTHLEQGIEAYLRTGRIRGTVAVLSDFLVEPAHYERALDRIRTSGCHVLALRLIGNIERDPSALPRIARLRDAETGIERLVELSTDHRTRYASALADHLEGIARWCRARGIGYALADTAAGIERCLVAELPRAGILQ